MHDLEDDADGATPRSQPHSVLAWSMPRPWAADVSRKRNADRLPQRREVVDERRDEVIRVLLGDVVSAVDGLSAQVRRPAAPNVERIAVKLFHVVARSGRSQPPRIPGRFSLWWATSHPRNG